MFRDLMNTNGDERNTNYVQDIDNGRSRNDIEQSSLPAGMKGQYERQEHDQNANRVTTFYHPDDIILSNSDGHGFIIRRLRDIGFITKGSDEPFALVRHDISKMVRIVFWRGKICEI